MLWRMEEERETELPDEPEDHREVVLDTAPAERDDGVDESDSVEYEEPSPVVDEDEPVVEQEDVLEAAVESADVVADEAADEPDSAVEEAAASVAPDEPESPAAATDEPEPAALAEPETETGLENAPTEVVARDRAPWWPFLVYEGFWLVFAGLLVWRLLQLPAGLASYEAAEYPLFLLGGLVLAAAGPVLLFAVWLATKGSAESRGLLFISALYRGAVVTFSGVVIWWAALIIVDQLRLGRLL